MKTKIIFIVVIPCDYSRADAVAFGTRKEAQAFIDELGSRDKEYAFIKEDEVDL